MFGDGKQYEHKLKRIRQVLYVEHPNMARRTKEAYPQLSGLDNQEWYLNQIHPLTLSKAYRGKTHTYTPSLLQSHLIFVQFAVPIFLFAFLLEGDNDKADEDIDHEEGNDDDVDDVEK